MTISQSQNSAPGAYLQVPGVNVKDARFQFWSQPVYQADDGRYWAPGFDGETFATNPWDFIRFANEYGSPTGGSPANRTPGICRVTIGKGYEIDTKKAVGGHGVRNTTLGVHAAGVLSTGKNKMPFDIEIEIWTPEQLRQLQAMWRYFVPIAGKGDPAQITATHPAFAVHGVTGVQFISGEGPMIGRDRRATFKIKAVEFMPPVKGKSGVKTAVATLPSTYDPAAGGLPGSNPADTGPH